MAEINIRELNYGTEGRFFPETHKLAVIGLKEELDNKANVDGFYETMGVGTAQKIEKEDSVSDEFLFRTTGGAEEVANGLASIQGVKGNSVKFNQLVQNGNFVNNSNWSVSTFYNQKVTFNNGIIFNEIPANTNYHNVSQTIEFINSHKYYASISGIVTSGSLTLIIRKQTGYDSAYVINTSVNRGGGIFMADDNIGIGLMSSVITITNGVINTVQIIDLTAMGIDNLTTVAQVEAYLRENFGEQEYYEYNAGSVVNVKMTGIEATDRNLLDSNGNAELIGNYDASGTYESYYGICGTHGTITFTDKQGTATTITPNSEGKFLIEKDGTLSVANAGSDCAVFLWWDGTKTDYEDHSVNVGRLDIPHIYGKKVGTDTLVQVWPTGMAGIGTLKDSLSIEDGNVVAKRVTGEVDLGRLYWTYSENYLSFFVTNSSLPSNFNKNTGGVKILCSKYPSKPYSIDDPRSLNNIIIGRSGYLSQYLVVTGSSYTDAVTFKTAVSGVMLYYELKTPEIYTDLVYMGSEYFEDGTPVILPVNYTVDNWGTEAILPKNTSTIYTSMPTIITKYALDIVEQVDTLNDTMISDNLIIAEALAKLNAEIESLKGQLQEYKNSAKFKSVDALEYLEYNAPRVLITSVEGAPSASVVPDNWDEERYGGWNGGARFVGQVYIAGSIVYIAKNVSTEDFANNWVALNNV